MRILNKKILKKASFLVGLILIGGVLFIANAFVGNPISSFRAKKTIEKYIEENYQNNDFELGKVKYNFKDGDYVSNIESKSSIDTKFVVQYKIGQIYSDDYESRVLGKFNTSMRLSEEFSNVIETFILEAVGYENKVSINNKSISGVKLDMDLDESLFINEKIILTLYLENSSEEEVVKALTIIHNKLVEEGYVFSEYNLFVKGEDYFSLSGIKAEDIQEVNVKDVIRHNGFIK